MLTRLSHLISANWSLDCRPCSDVRRYGSTKRSVVVTFSSTRRPENCAPPVKTSISLRPNGFSSSCCFDEVRPPSLGEQSPIRCGATNQTRLVPTRSRSISRESVPRLRAATPRLRQSGDLVIEWSRRDNRALQSDSRGQGRRRRHFDRHGQLRPYRSHLQLLLDRSLNLAG